MFAIFVDMIEKCIDLVLKLMEEGQAQPHKKDKSQDISIQSQIKSV